MTGVLSYRTHAYAFGITPITDRGDSKPHAPARVANESRLLQIARRLHMPGMCPTRRCVMLGSLQTEIRFFDEYVKTPPDETAAIESFGSGKEGHANDGALRGPCVRPA